jgi:hypothetical protein
MRKQRNKPRKPENNGSSRRPSKLKRTNHLLRLPDRRAETTTGMLNVWVNHQRPTAYKRSTTMCQIAFHRGAIIASSVLLWTLLIPFAPVAKATGTGTEFDNRPPSLHQMERRDLAVELLKASLTCNFSQKWLNGSRAVSLSFTGDADFFGVQIKEDNFPLRYGSVQKETRRLDLKAAYANLDVEENRGYMGLYCKPGLKCFLHQAQGFRFDDGTFGSEPLERSNGNQIVDVCPGQSPENVKLAMDVLSAYPSKPFEDEPVWRALKAVDDADQVRAFVLNYPWSVHTDEAKTRLASAAPPAVAKNPADWPTLPESREFFPRSNIDGYSGPDDPAYAKTDVFHKNGRLYADGRVGQWLRVHDLHDRPAFVHRSQLIEASDFETVKSYQIDAKLAHNLLYRVAGQLSDLVAPGLYSQNCEIMYETDNTGFQDELKSQIYWAVGGVLYRAPMMAPRTQASYELGKKHRLNLDFGVMNFFDLTPLSGPAEGERVAFPSSGNIWWKDRNADYQGLGRCKDLSFQASYLDTAWRLYIKKYIDEKANHDGF